MPSLLELQRQRKSGVILVFGEQKAQGTTINLKVQHYPINLINSVSFGFTQAYEEE